MSVRLCNALLPMCPSLWPCVYRCLSVVAVPIISWYVFLWSLSVVVGGFLPAEQATPSCQGSAILVNTSRSGRISKVRLDVGEVSRTGNTPLQDVGVWGSVDIISAPSSCTKNIGSVQNMLPRTEYLKVTRTQPNAESEYHVDELSIQRSKREITTHKEGTNGSLHSDETVVTVCSICIMFDTDVQVFF